MIGTDSNDRIVAVEVDTSNPPVTLVEQGSQAHLSPDGRWLAYTTTISGTPEVYVQGFPGGERPVRVSAHGGMQPRWRGDGGELFYLTADGTLVAVGFSRLLQGGEPTRLFREPFLRTGPTPFDRTYLPGRDGQSFLLLQYSSGPVPLTAVRNWLPLPRQ